MDPSFRRQLFLHQDGVTLCLTIHALQQGRILDQLRESRRLTIRDIVRWSGGTAGYLHIALRSLAAQGWLERTGPFASDDTAFALTGDGRVAASLFPLYDDMAAFLSESVPFERHLVREPRLTRALADQVAHATHDWDLLPSGDRRPLVDLAVAHLQGALIVPTMMALMALDRVGRTLSPRYDDPAEVWLGSVRALLDRLGWLDASAHWTRLGQEACAVASHYGLIGSYFPMLQRLAQLLFHPGGLATHMPDDSHVFRDINVRASGEAHRRYFADADDVFRDLFDRVPVDAQPRFVADMGCGDGSWLRHLYELIRHETVRGAHLGDHPLLMIGADFNASARAVTRATLAEAGIPALVLFGDVSDPAAFAASLEQHGIDPTRGLHVRSFLDHNRRYVRPGTPLAVPDAPSSGAWVDEQGRTIAGDELESELTNHLQKWVPYLERYGLVVLEAHAVHPQVSARHLGALHSVTFDTYHGFSCQYPVEYEVFMRSCQRAGLESTIYHQRRYPTRLPFVCISLNRFVVGRGAVLPAPTASHRRATPAADRETWQPGDEGDHADGAALHALLYERGDLRWPRRWCAGAGGVLVRWATQALKSRLARIRSGVAEPSVVVLDYGTGTGFQVIELLKAWHEMGLVDLLERMGVELRLLLADIPSPWFATAYALLRKYDYVSFHALRSPATREFVPLSSIVPGRHVDVAMCSMVFHLLPPAVLPRVMRELAGVLRDDGELVWSSPDIGPARPGALLFHDPNRAMRRLVLRMLDGDEDAEALLGRAPGLDGASAAELLEALRTARTRLTPAQRAAIERQANGQILPRGTDLGVLIAAMEPWFTGDVVVSCSEMLATDVVDTMLIPANQRYVGEIEDRSTRERLIRTVLTGLVLPDLVAGEAGTGFGLSVQWSFGRLRRGGGTVTVSDSGHAY